MEVDKYQDSLKQELARKQLENQRPQQTEPTPVEDAAFGRTYDVPLGPEPPLRLDKDEGWQNISGNGGRECGAWGKPHVG